MYKRKKFSSSSPLTPSHTPSHTPSLTPSHPLSHPPSHPPSNISNIFHFVPSLHKKKNNGMDWENTNNNTKGYIITNDNIICMDYIN